MIVGENMAASNGAAILLINSKVSQSRLENCNDLNRKINRIIRCSV